MHSRRSLAADFRRLGVRPGDLLMLHVSVRAVGQIAGGPDQIHLALQDAAGEAGTLLMYVSCPRFYDEVGRGNLTPAEEQEILEHLPAFDALTARADQENGVLAEFFRTWPGTTVNDHVTRFAVRGARAAQLLAAQPWDFAFGHGSILERFVDLDGRIALIGSDHDNTTLLHYVEHVADLPGRRVVRVRVPVAGPGGWRRWREMQEVDSSGAHEHWPDRFFASIVDGFIRGAGLEARLVGHARTYLLPARELVAFARPIMERVAREGAGTVADAPDQD